ATAGPPRSGWRRSMPEPATSPPSSIPLRHDSRSPRRRGFRFHYRHGNRHGRAPPPEAAFRRTQERQAPVWKTASGGYANGMISTRLPTGPHGYSRSTFSPAGGGKSTRV